MLLSLTKFIPSSFFSGLDKLLFPYFAKHQTCAIHKTTSASLKYFQNIYSFKFIRILSSFEFVFYIYLLFTRIRILNHIKSIPKGLRELIDLYDYENGWNFIFLLILLTSIILTFSKKRFAWPLKQTGLICISVTLIFKSALVILTILLLIYYSKNMTMKQFDITSKEKLCFYITSVVAALLLLFCSMTFELLKY